MTTEIIEGTATEVTPEPNRAVVVAQPGQALVTESTVTGPADMIQKATGIATALRDIVERQRLYATIQGKKYPQVEAWSTIGRMDNVVAREASRPIRHDDGSYEAEVELVRLSDGMVIGRASALCGMPDDKPWATRAEYARRSMAVTRATSRAFRQQYSWIMALAGYEPTPADEMPQDARDVSPRDEPTPDGSLIGTVAAGKAPVDLELRQTPDGMACGFALVDGRQKLQVLAVDPLASALHPLLAGLVGQRVKVWGSIVMIDWKKDGKDMPAYRRVMLERIETPDWTLPAVSVAPEPSGEPMLPLDEDEKALIAGSLA